MGRIHILSDQVANQIAAGEVVDRPASVVKELLENALDAGATRIDVQVEGGGRKLIRIVDNGCGMVRDDALLAFERHATSKLRASEDLLSIATLGFRGEALPSIASIARVELVTRAGDERAGTRMEIAGGKLLVCEEVGAPPGTSIAVRDLFFNTPARRKFLKAENTELAHVTALVTHYALAHPDKHFELHSATHALLVAPPVRVAQERIFQIFGKDTLDQLLPLAAEGALERSGLPEPPPWQQPAGYQSPEPGWLHITGFASKPELQKLNRNSIYCFVNRRLVRDRVLMHAVGEAYRNILPPTSFPVVLLFIELPPEEVDVNVHPAKTEVRFRQGAWLHDFVRDSIRNKLTVGRPAAGFLQALGTHPDRAPALVPDSSPSARKAAETPDSGGWVHGDSPGGDFPGGNSPGGDSLGRDSLGGDSPGGDSPGGDSLDDGSLHGASSMGEASPVFLPEDAGFHLVPPPIEPVAGVLPFAPFAPNPDSGHGPGASASRGPASASAVAEMPHPAGTAVAAPLTTLPASSLLVRQGRPSASCSSALATLEVEQETVPSLHGLASLRPLGQLRNSFILAVNQEGLWIIDQHVAHERVLFERILRERRVERVQRQRLLMPILLDLLPAQMVTFAAIARELEANGFEVEPFGPRTLAVKAAPVGLEGNALERMLVEVLEQGEAREQAENLEFARARIAASIACHAAIKINTPLDLSRMEWLLAELALTQHPTGCPHGRPIVLRYSLKDIQRAFHRI